MLTLDVRTVSSVNGMVGVGAASVPAWYMVPVAAGLFKKSAWPVIAIDVVVLCLDDVVSVAVVSCGKVKTASNKSFICPVPPLSE